MAIFTAVATAVSTWFAGLSVFAQIAVRLVAGLALNALGAALAGKPPGPKPPGIKQAIEQGADLPRAFVVGYHATAGSLVYHNSSSNKRWYRRITALSDLPVQELIEVWVDGKRGEIDWTDPDPDGKGYPILVFKKAKKKYDISFLSGKGAVTEQENTQKLGYVKFYDGTQTVADPFMVSEYSADEARPWTSEDVGRGVAYAVTHFRNDGKTFTGLPQIVYVLRGISLADPQGGAASYGEQPGRIAYTLLNGLSFNGVHLYGPQTTAPMDGAEWAGQIAIEASAPPGSSGLSDAEKLEIYGSTTVPARYRAGYEVTVDTPIADVIETITAASNGQVSFVGDRYRYRLGDPASAVASLTDGDILTTSAQMHAQFPPLAEMANAITAKYPDPEQVWQLESAPILTDAGFEAEDGDRQLPVSADLTAVPYPEQVQRLMAAALAEARQARTHRLPLPARFAPLEVDDHIQWTSARNGYTDKLFRVDAVTLSANGDVFADVTETDPSNYSGWAPLADFTAVAAGSTAEAPAAVIAVEGFAVQPVAIPDGAAGSRRPGIALTWTAPDNVAVTGMMWHVRLVSTGDLVSVATVLDAETGGQVISDGILPDQDYEVRVRYFCPDADCPWTDWAPVTSPDVRLSSIDLTDALAQTIQDAFDRHDAALGDATGTVADLIAAIEGSIAPLDSATPLIDTVTAQLPRITDAEKTLDDIYERMIDLQGGQFGLQETLAGAGVFVDSVTGEVRIHAFEQAAERVATVEIDLSAVEAELALRATVAYVDQTVTDALLDPSQIPVIGDLTARVTTVEATLSAETARIDLLSDTLTVEGGLVTMTTVTQTLDSLQGQIDLRVEQSEFDTAEARLSAAETSLSALGDTAVITSAVEATRIIQREQDDETELSIANLWNRWATDASVIEATAQGRRDLRAFVDDGFSAEATERLSLAAQVAATNAALSVESTARADGDSALASQVTALEASLDGDIAANASAITALDARVTTTEGDVAAQASSLTQLQSDLGDAEAAVTDLQATRVTASGAVAAVTTEISASFATLAAMASTTSSVKATQDGITAGYVLRLNGSNVFEAVSVATGTSGAVTTAKLAADYVQITGLAQIDNAVIANLAASSALINNLEIGRAQVTDVIESDNYVAGTAGLSLNFATGAIDAQELTVARSNINPGAVTEQHYASEPATRTTSLTGAAFSISGAVAQAETAGGFVFFRAGFSAEARMPFQPFGGGDPVGSTRIFLQSRGRNTSAEAWSGWAEVPGSSVAGNNVNFQPVSFVGLALAQYQIAELRVALELIDPTSGTAPQRDNIKLLKFWAEAAVR